MLAPIQPIDRRTFLGTTAAALAAWETARLTSAAADLPKDLRITRIVAFDLPLKRSKVAGRNARLDVHGDRSSDGMWRVYTNHGIEGLGACRADRKTADSLIGKDPFAFYRQDARRMDGPLGNGTMPLWDLAGKALKTPAYKLLGGAGEEKVPVYDGSIYFADLLPQYADRWQDRFQEEIDMGRRLGHVAFKIKIGRGNKWMPRAAGDNRDVEVVQLIRRVGGGR